jgi:hypothetical protein
MRPFAASESADKIQITFKEIILRQLRRFDPR